MRTSLAIIVALGLVVLAIALPLEDAFEIRAGRGRAIEDAVRDLGAPSFDRRERATRRLLSLGEAARGALETVTGGESLEARRRARAILDALDLRRLSLSDRRRPAFRRMILLAIGDEGAFRPGGPRFTALSLDPGVAATAAAEVALTMERDPERHDRAVRLLRDLMMPEAASYLASMLARGQGMGAAMNDAVETLIRVGGPAQLPDLRLAAGSRDLPVPRRYALRALAILGGKTDLPLARDAANALEGEVRAEAARALRLLGGRETVPDLLALTGDEDGTVRRAAIEALAELPTPDFRPASIGSLTDVDPGVRSAGVLVLGLRGEREDLIWVRRALSDASAAVRAEAVRAMARLGEAVSASRTGLGDRDPGVRHAALRILTGIPAGDRTGILSRAPEEADPWLAALRAAIAD